MNQWTSPNKQIQLFCGDCREVLPTLQQESITAVVTDPPYGLEFMGQDWDKQVPGKHFWELINQVCVPGAPLLSFGGTRTYHRLVCAIEDAGWEIRDFIDWIYGSGFPKSLDISKAIDRKVGAKREKVQPGNAPSYQRHLGNDRPWMYDNNHKIESNNPVTDETKLWQGYGTVLKPAHEPICLAMKPLSEKTYAKNALVKGVAGINVDGCRVGNSGGGGSGWGRKGQGCHFNKLNESDPMVRHNKDNRDTLGRWPANVIHDGSDEVVGEFPNVKGFSGGGIRKRNPSGDIFVIPVKKDFEGSQPYCDEDSAARFFYCAKPTEKEKDANFKVLNIHTTVKPLALMRYLLKLVTMPERNLILDPFMGSGTTGVACQELGLPFIGIDDSERSFQIARDRIIASNTERVNTGNLNSDCINQVS